MKLHLIGAALALTLAGTATQALAHAHLVAADPAANAVAPAPKQLTLKFSERLEPKFSGLAVTMPQMSGMAAAAKVEVSPDGKSLIATPSAPLSAGVYKVSWHAVTADTHRTEGAFTFTVR
ncbi:copper homeostasis periplasmic binding protein CopC [Phenylobacterium montanum]|uniref:Copper homeostasis periplasmic binding protein CopC n=1 Tax=Phenylobacterium montanum TaxID=2823693 RepID=A0A975G457_9CAUL|nr:copper homeostasis periplasmic binding protein CopC [Caulobacter sp. S6]QUD90535.1 copper homeostasis periplasmic binding protein CopC [Caulobacter sp. S6]